MIDTANATTLVAEAWPPTAAWDAKDVGSRCAQPSHTWWNRPDPMWSTLFDQDSYAAWSSAAGLRRNVAADVALAPAKALSRTRDEAVDAVLSPRGSLTRWRMLSAAHLFRTLTLPQWAALVGSPRAVSWTSFEALPLFQAGLVDVGHLRAPGVGAWAPGVDTGLVRPADTTVWDARVAPALPWTTWLAVSGGAGWSGGRGLGSDRHNVLATELALRLMEIADVSAVLPEALCDVGVLAGLEPGARATGTADLAMVRPDGARIGVEVTCNPGDGDKLGKKIMKWVRAMSEPTPQARALGVVFLIAPRNPGTAAPGALRRSVMRAIARHLHDGFVAADVASRIGVATWREWFPQAGMVSQEFFDQSVAVWSPGALGAPGTWARQSWSGATPAWAPRPEDRHALGSVTEHTRVIAGLPRWFRESGPEPLLAALLMSAAGRASFPQRPRPGAPRDRAPVGLGWGAASPAKAPHALTNRL